MKYDFSQLKVNEAIRPSLSPAPRHGLGATTVYRLILGTPTGDPAMPMRWDTGGTYPGCSGTNPAACDPFQFASLADAVAYAKSRNEIPYRVQSVEEGWGVAEGRIPIDPAQIVSGGLENLSGGVWIAAGAAVLLLMAIRRK